MTDIIFTPGATEGDDDVFKEVNGDIVIEESRDTIIKDLLEAMPGHFKEFPTLGIGIWQYINSDRDPQVIARNIKVGLQADIFSNPKVNMSEWPPKIKVDEFEIQSDG